MASPSSPSEPSPRDAVARACRAVHQYLPATVHTTGAEVTIEIRVTAKASTAASDIRNVDVTLKSTSAPTMTDVVGADITPA